MRHSFFTPIELDLSNNKLGSSFLDLLESPNLRELQRLSINSNALENEGIVELSKLSFKRLRTLNLSANHIRHDGAATLANSPNLRTLKRLTLWANRFQTVLDSVVTRVDHRRCRRRKRTAYGKRRTRRSRKCECL